MFGLKTRHYEIAPQTKYIAYYFLSINLKNTSTTLGSKCEPAFWRIYSIALFFAHAGRYGRSLVSASKTSTTANSRAASGISSPFSPRG